MDTNKRWQVAIEVAMIAFFFSAGLGCFIAHAHHAEFRSYMTVVGVPACASALFVAIGCFFNDVIDVPTLRFPLNLTLPLIFCSLLPVASIIVATPERSLLALQETLAYAQIWRQPGNLSIVFLGMVTALSLLTVLSRRSG